MTNDGKYFEQAVETDLALKRAAFDRDAAEVFLDPEPMTHYELPVIDAEQFGIFAKDVRCTVEMVRRFLAMPVIPSRFSDHQAWSDWKYAMRAKYGQHFANEQLQRFSDNKLRTNILSGVCVAGDSVIYALEHGGESDKVFAAKLESMWEPKNVFKLIEAYKTLPLSERMKLLPYFDEKALELLRLLSEEAERRSMRVLPRGDSQEVIAAAK